MLEISIIGIFTGVLILVILILNLQSSPLANKLLIGVILPFTLAQLLFYLYVSGLGIYVPYTYRLPSPLYLAMYPMAYLYVRTFIQDKEVLSKKDYLHFLPAFLHLIQMIPFYLMPLEQKRAIVAEVIQNGEKMIQFKEGGLPAYVQFGILFIQGSIYCFLSYRMILKAKVAQSSNLFQSGKKWLYTFVSLMVLVLLALASSLILPTFDNLGKINFWIISMMISMLMLTCYLFIQPNILYGIPRINHDKQDIIQINVLKEKEIRNNISKKAKNDSILSYSDELIQKDDIVLQGDEIPVYNVVKQDKDFNYLKEYAPLVESFFKNKQPYLNKGYSISQLSEDTGIPVHHLSALFNKVYGIRFNEYLNSYRLQYLEVNLTNPDFQDFSQEGLAWQAGFNSRISFFNALKKLRGMSPAEFLQNRK